MEISSFSDYQSVLHSSSKKENTQIFIKNKKRQKHVARHNAQWDLQVFLPFKAANIQQNN